MKYLFYLLCFLSFSVQGQVTLDGVVVSSKTSEPIPYVHIYTTGAGQFRGTVTNLDGAFVLNRLSPRDTVRMTCVGYEPLTFLAGVIKKDTLRMNESLTELPAVDVRPLTAKDFFIRCLERIPDNYLNAVFLNRGFTWQSLKVDTTFRKLVQSFVTLKEINTATKTVKSVRYDSTGVMGQYADAPVFPEFDSLDDHLYFDLIRTGSGILNKDQVGEWSFSYSYDANVDYDKMTVIDAKSRGTFVNSFRFFIYDADLSFHRIDFAYQWKQTIDMTSMRMLQSAKNRDVRDSVRYALRDVKGVALYEKTHHKYNLKYLFNEIYYTQYILNHDLMIPVKSAPVYLTYELVILESEEHAITKNRKPLKRNRTEIPATIIEKDKFGKAKRDLEYSQ